MYGHKNLPINFLPTKRPPTASIYGGGLSWQIIRVDFAQNWLIVLYEYHIHFAFPRCRTPLDQIGEKCDIPQWMPFVVYHLDAIFHSPTTKLKQFIEQCHVFFLPFCWGVNLKLSRYKHRMFLPSCGSFQYRILKTCLSVQTLSPFCVSKLSSPVCMSRLSTPSCMLIIQTLSTFLSVQTLNTCLSDEPCLSQDR